MTPIERIQEMEGYLNVYKGLIEEPGSMFGDDRASCLALYRPSRLLH